MSCAKAPAAPPSAPRSDLADATEAVLSSEPRRPNESWRVASFATAGPAPTDGSLVAEADASACSPTTGTSASADLGSGVSPSTTLLNKGLARLKSMSDASTQVSSTSFSTKSVDALRESGAVTLVSSLAASFAKPSSAALAACTAKSSATCPATSAEGSAARSSAQDWVGLESTADTSTMFSVMSWANSLKSGSDFPDTTECTAVLVASFCSVAAKTSEACAAAACATGGPEPVAVPTFCARAAACVSAASASANRSSATASIVVLATDAAVEAKDAASVASKSAEAERPA
mmetsp:Transcript_67457/g.124254  ORF Transcript_67457/g.124254 Transcript_67457/m.124254 type:complete len:292 (+) Transcript_67457:2832-3707(+)